MASIRSSVLALAVLFMSFSSSSLALPTSFIAASPALLPNPPLSSPPAFSPDITPQFPSSATPGLSPTESSVPTIPSSPSPPNPDSMLAPGPGIAFSPSGSLPTSSSFAPYPFGALNYSLLVLGLLAFWLM